MLDSMRFVFGLALGVVAAWAGVWYLLVAAGVFRKTDQVWAIFGWPNTSSVWWQVFLGVANLYFAQLVIRWALRSPAVDDLW